MNTSKLIPITRKAWDKVLTAWPSTDAPYDWPNAPDLGLRVVDGVVVRFDATIEQVLMHAKYALAGALAYVPHERHDQSGMGGENPTREDIYFARKLIDQVLSDAQKGEGNG